MTPVNPVHNPVSQIFTEPQRQLLTATLNRLIPAQGDFPGGGDLGLAAFVERAVSQESGSSPGSTVDNVPTPPRLLAGPVACR